MGLEKVEALQNLVVLDLTRVVAGPYAGSILGDFGAEVIKIEVPGKGDDARSYGPYRNGESVYYANLNRNKKGITLNLKTEEGKKIFLELVNKADILLENYRPGVMERLGLGYEVLREKNPRLIYGAVSGFGCYGSYSDRPGYDIISQAMGGLMSVTGAKNGDPTRSGNAMGDILGGMNLVIGVLMALNVRTLTGKGQKVDVSLVDSVVASLENAYTRYFESGQLPVRNGNAYASIAPYDSYQAKDGQVIIACGNQKLYEKLCNEVLHMPWMIAFEVFLGSAKNNWMSTDWQKPTDNIYPLLDCILENIPAPTQLEGTPQMLVTSLDYSSYTGRIAVGRVHRGTLREGMNVSLAKRDGTIIKSKIKELHTFEGMGRVKVSEVSSGDICALVGIEGFEIGDTICDYENPEALPPIAIDEPTMSMLFTINDSPFFGKEGKFVTSRHIQDRLTKELDKNLALRVRKSELEDGKWIVSGRGVLHLSVLIETMRREGYELQVGQPQVIFKEIDGVKCEPIEELTISVPEEYSSKMIDMVTRRKGDLVSMETQGDRVNIEFDMPSRGIIGLRTNVLTASAGEAIMAHRFKCYQPYKGEIERRSNGSMIAMESGTAFAYAIDKLQDRGKFFIYPQDEVYAGQVVGEHVHENDLVINVTKSKKLTNMRASGSDDKARIIPPVVFSLEEALEYIKEDEYVEVTPKSMRMRKVILDETERKRANKS